MKTLAKLSEQYAVAFKSDNHHHLNAAYVIKVINKKYALIYPNKALYDKIALNSSIVKIKSKVKNVTKGDY